MMKRWTIQRLIVASFGVILALMVGTTAIAWLRLARIGREVTAVQTTSIPALYYSSMLQDAWTDDFVLPGECLPQADPKLREPSEAPLPPKGY